MKKKLVYITINERIKRLKETLETFDNETEGVKFEYRNYIKFLNNQLEEARLLKIQRRSFLSNLIKNGTELRKI